MPEREKGAYPRAVCDLGTPRPGGLLLENTPGGSALGYGQRWLSRHSPLRGCCGLADLAAAKIPRRTTPRTTGSFHIHVVLSN